MTYTTETLPSGLRIICAPSPTDVVYCGIAIDSGTRDEGDKETGIAHFTEHLTFKGTQRRKAWHIINRMESVGGDLNAYTGKEETVYYCTFPREHFSRAIDLLTDIVLHSTYPQHEMDKEVEVVIEEIESYNDSPSELIYDDFEALLFPQHPLGRSILGDADCLRQMGTYDIQRYANRQYRLDKMVLFLYGNVSMREILRCVNRADLQKESTEMPLPRIAPKAFFPSTEPIIIKKDTHQAHVMMGCRCYGGNDLRRLHLYVLNNLLGGPGMSSRLNLTLREHNGLVYNVESNIASYTDAGIWTVYFGCDQGNVEHCRKLVCNELQRLTDAPLSERALAALKKQLKGQICISYDNFEGVAIGMGKRFLHYGTTQTQENLCEKIEALTPNQLWETAKDVLCPDKLTTLVYG